MNISSLSLADLAQLLATEGLLSEKTHLTAEEGSLFISGADCDSRVVEPGHLFICKGSAFKSAYLSSARKCGASAYLCDIEHADMLAQTEPDMPALVSTDIRRAMALVSAAAFRHPDRSLKTVGITGTKGKSTTTFMLRSILDEGAATARCGLIGSIETFDGTCSIESLNTTPEAPDLWRYLAHMRDSGLEYALMEVSSQALKYNRVDNLALEVACFLNIGRDHISPLEHPDWDDYFASKLRIFSQAHCAVINTESEHLSEIMEHARRCPELITFSATDPAADIWAHDITSALGHVSFICRTASWEGPISLAMPGLFNVENALCAIACAEHFSIPYEQVAAGLAHTQVPGRMELIQTPNGTISGIIDFAHNRMAFERFFPSVRAEFPEHNLIAVFGATGDKALERRYELPEVASRYAEHLIFTKDDPGCERVEDICAEMEQAVPEGVCAETVPDRLQALERAIELAATLPGNSVICVLGRGTQALQHEQGGFTPAPLDAELFRRALSSWQEAHPQVAL